MRVLILEKEGTEEVGERVGGGCQMRDKHVERVREGRWRSEVGGEEGR